MPSFQEAWDTISGIVLFVLGVIVAAFRREIDGVKGDTKGARDAADKTGRDLAAHQLYAAETYARKVDVERTIEKSEERIMKRLEELAEEIRERMPPKHH